MLDFEIVKVGVEFFDFEDEVVGGVVSDVVLGEVDGGPSVGGGEDFGPGVSFGDGSAWLDVVAGEASAGDAA